MSIQIGPCCLVLLNFKLKNEASRASLNKNKRVFKWRPFWNKVYNGNWTEWSAIWSEIIRVISKSNERAAHLAVDIQLKSQTFDMVCEAGLRWSKFLSLSSLVSKVKEKVWKRIALLMHHWESSLYASPWQAKILTVEFGKLASPSIQESKIAVKFSKRLSIRTVTSLRDISENNTIQYNNNTYLIDRSP